MAYKWRSRNYTPIDRAISIADYIIEGNGHSTKEAAKEFELSATTIQRSLQLLGQVAFYSVKPNIELQKKYREVQKTLKSVEIRRRKEEA